MRKIVYVMFFIPALNGCVEPFEAEVQLYEGALVVDAFLTDEDQNHEVLLSRARAFNDDDANAELGATVKIVDDLGNEYNFDEIGEGRYVSKVAFRALQNSGYRLLINTTDNSAYSSSMVFTPNTTEIKDLFAERNANGTGEEGLSIRVNTNNANSEIAYYRYEYEETYKIIAPFWNPFDFVVIDDLWFVGELGDTDGFEVGIELKDQEERVCYNTELSTRIIQTTTVNLDENVISDFELRFISQIDPIISHRYSVLVKQYRQTEDAFSYYRNLQNFSSTESIFSAIQPGFLEGNISSDSNASEKVLGYFEVVSTDAKRLFVNYVDEFPNEPLPPYFINCEPVGQPLLYVPSASGARSPLIDAIKNGLIKYHATNEQFDQNNLEMVTNGEGGPFFTKSRACGDCTVLGSNMAPEFWIE
ncbi:MAG: DUF4249 domain-containing protein [Maribacter sp.]|uniref:DUF4249 domain-containing protein n=1 Tax=Maribacter sp. TaxID=1897614 RepID=UPI003298CF2F